MIGGGLNVISAVAFYIYRIENRKQSYERNKKATSLALWNRFQRCPSHDLFIVLSSIKTTRDSSIGDAGDINECFGFDDTGKMEARL